MRIAKAAMTATLLAIPTIIQAQNAPDQAGMWWDAGAAWGSYGCENCTDRMGGFGGGASVGGTLRPDLLLGVAGNGFIGNIDGDNEGVFALTPVVRYYPGGNRLSLLGGVGLGLQVHSRDDTDAGPGAVLGVAYDIRSAQSARLNVYCRGVAVSAGQRSDLLLVGLGLTTR